jgi:hypothetical protein
LPKKRTAAAWFGAVLGLAACSLEPLTGLTTDAPAGADGGGAEAGNELEEAGPAAPDGSGVSPDGGTPVGNGGGDGGISCVQMAYVRAATRTAVAGFPDPIRAHDTLIVAFDFDNGLTVVKVSDKLGNVYQPVVAGPEISYDVSGYVYAAYDVVGGVDSVSVDLDGSPTVFTVLAHEYTGIAREGFDVSAKATGSSAAADAVELPVSTATDRELVFAYGFALRIGGEGTVTTGKSMHLLQSTAGGLSEDAIVPSHGTFTPTATMLAGTQWSFRVAAFNPQPP